MTQDDVYIQLSAYADGELPVSDRAALEARLAQDPALVKILNAFKKLASTAKSESVPDVFVRETKSWPLVSQHVQSYSSVQAEKLDALARAEVCPVMSEEFARRTWWAIAGRTIHSFNNSALFNAPKVSDANWSKAWKHITTRARIAVPEQKKDSIQKPASPASKVVPITSAPKVQRSSFWTWALATAAASAAMLALILSAPENQGVPDAPSFANSMAMSIPESQDDRYGVLVKYVPGNDDPVICLYEKSRDSGGK